MERSRGPLEDTVREILGHPGIEPRMDGLELRPLGLVEDAFDAAAIDGGQSLVADVGSGGIIALRAGYTLGHADGGIDDVRVHDQVAFINRSRIGQRWRDLQATYRWGIELEPPNASGHQWARSWLEAERTLAEFDAARKAVEELESEDILLLDGSLDGDATYPQLVEALLQVARRKGVVVLGVTKDTSLSIQGALPFTVELEQLAQRQKAPAKFAADVTAALGRSGGFSTYGARFDAVSPVYRVDVAGAPETHPRILGRLLGLCNDVSYPGYPYLLARVHQHIHYSDDEAADLRHRLESIVAERRGSLFSMRLFGRGRDVLALGG